MNTNTWNNSRNSNIKKNIDNGNIATLLALDAPVLSVHMQLPSKPLSALDVNCDVRAGFSDVIKYYFYTMSNSGGEMDTDELLKILQGSDNEPFTDFEEIEVNDEDLEVSVTLCFILCVVV